MRVASRQLAALLLGLCAVLLAHAGIYKWTDADGKVHYSDTVAEGQAAEPVVVREINTFTDVSISDAPGWAGFYEPEPGTQQKRVLMYSTTRCGACKQARRYFEQQGIRFTEKKIDESKEAYAEFEKLGANGVPVIFVGRKRLNGFSRAAFDNVFYQ